MSEAMTSEQRPAEVPEAKQAGETEDRWSWVERSVWTERMLKALEKELERLQRQLREGRYRPQRIRRHYIDKQRWTPSVGPLGGISKVDSAVLVAASKGNSERGRA